MSDRRRNLVAPIAWSIFLLWRVPAWPVLSGAPLSPLSTAALAAVWWLWAIRRHLPYGRLVAVLAIARIAMAPALIDRGLRASYYANSTWQGRPETGLYIRDGSATELDSRLAFGTQGERDLPVFFFNDSTRYNFYQPGQSDVGLLGYSAAWTGHLQIEPSKTRLEIYLRGGGVAAQADVEGFTVVRLAPGETEQSGQVTLKPGLRQLSIRVSGAYGAPRRIEAGLVDPATGAHRPFDAANVFASAARPWRLTIDAVARIVAAGLDLLAAALLVLSAIRELPGIGPFRLQNWRRIAVIAGSGAAIVEALWFMRFFHDHLILWGGGDDWLMYETYARDIALHGPLMTLGRPLGQGDAFYFQPLYSYFLALTHLVWGESLWGAFFLQRLFQTVTVFSVSAIADLLFGGAAAVGTFVAATTFALTEIDGLTRIFLSENLFIPLICVWTMCLVRVAIDRPSRVPVGTGVWGGLATLTRSTLLLAWPPIFAVLAIEYRRLRRSVRPLVLLVLATSVVIGVATARNWVVSRKFVTLTTSFGMTFKVGNQPPPGLPRHDPAIRGMLAYVSSDPNVVDTLEFAVEAPRVFLEGLGRKAAYTLGWFPVLNRDVFKESDRELMFTWMLALAGVMIWIGGRAPRVNDAGLARWIPLIVALTHFASVVLILPQVYVRRLILPFYVMLLPYAGLAVATLASLLPRNRTVTRT